MLEAGGIPGLGEESLRARGVVGDRPEQGLRRPRVGRVVVHGADGGAEAAQHLLDDGPLVHREVEGQPHLPRALGVGLGPGHLRIVGRLRGPLAAEDHPHRGHVGHRDRAEPHGLQLGHVLPADLDHVDAARPQHGHPRGRLRHLHEDEPLPVRRGPPVVLHRLVHDAVAAHVLHELPGPGADGQPLGAVFTRLDVLLRLDVRHRGEEAVGDPVAEGHEGLLEADADDVRALDLHALDEAELGGERVGRAVPRHHGEGELHVLGRHLGAVVEADALAQVELPRAAAVRHLPALGEHRREVALGVAVEEVLPQRLEDDVFRPDVQVRQPALVAEGRHRHRERPFGSRGAGRSRGHREGERDRERRHQDESGLHVRLLSAAAALTGRPRG